MLAWFVLHPAVVTSIFALHVLIHQTDISRSIVLKVDASKAHSGHIVCPRWAVLGALWVYICYYIFSSDCTLMMFSAILLMLIDIIDIHVY